MIALGHKKYKSIIECKIHNIAYSLAKFLIKTIVEQTGVALLLFIYLSNRHAIVQRREQI